MLKSILFIGCILGISSLVLAGEKPRVALSGATSGQPGDLIEVRVAPAGIKFVQFEVRPDRFSDGRTTHRIVEDGFVCEIATRPGVYDITVAVSNDDGLATGHWQVVVSGGGQPAPTPNPPTPNPQPQPDPAPQPIPPPVPPPGPAPVPPAPQPSGLAADVVRWAAAVQSPTKVQDAQRLATDCLAVKEQIGTTLSGWRNIAAAIKTQVNTTLGSNLVAWKPFADQLTIYLTKQLATGKLGTNADWQLILGELATGLKAVR